MSKVSFLNENYCNFFQSVAMFSVSPYITAMGIGYALTNDTDANGKKLTSSEFISAKKINGFMVAAALTVIPVLPALTLLTFGVAVLSAVIAGLSMFFTYPQAAFLDCAIPVNNP